MHMLPKTRLQALKKARWSITYQVLPEGEFISAFQHSIRSLSPPYRDLFSLNLHS